MADINGNLNVSGGGINLKRFCAGLCYRANARWRSTGRAQSAAIRRLPRTAPDALQRNQAHSGVIPGRALKIRRASALCWPTGSQERRSVLLREVGISIFQVRVLVPMAKLPVGAHIATLVVLVLFRCTLTPILVFGFVHHICS